MALLFDGINQYLQTGDPSVTYPFAISAWVKADATTGLHTAVSIGDTGGAVNYFQLGINVNGTPFGRARATGFSTFSATDDVSLNTWHNILVIFKTTTDREIYLDGRVETRGSAAHNIAPGGIDQYAVGRLVTSTPGDYFSGSIAEVAIWQLSSFLNSQEIAAIGKYSALFIRPSELIVYDRLEGVLPTIDMVGGFSLTAFNGPVVAPDTPPVLQPGHQSEPVAIDGVFRVEQEFLFNQSVGVEATLNLSVTNQLDFFQAANPHVIQLSVTTQFDITQEATTDGSTINLVTTQALLFEQNARRTILESASNTLTFGQDGNRAGVGSGVLVFGQALTLEQVKVASNNLVFGQIVVITQPIKSVTASSIFLCDGFGSIQVISPVVPGVCNPEEIVDLSVNNVNYNSPDSIISPKSSTDLILRETIEFYSTIGPTTVELRVPSFGNNESHTKGNLFKRLRGGALSSNHITAKPLLRTFSITVPELKDTDRDAIQSFIALTLGTRVRYTDASSQIYSVIISNPNGVITETAKGRYEATFELELDTVDAYGGP